MPFGYTPPGRIVELNNLARLRRLNGAFHGAVGATLRYDLLTNERLLYNLSPTSSDVMRGTVNYLFKNGSLSPEQWGYTDLVLVDTPGSAQLEYDIDGTNTCVRFGHVPDPTSNTSLHQYLKLNCTALFALYPAFTTNTWHTNFVFKLDSALGVGVNSILFSANGLDDVGLFAQGNHILIRAVDATNDSWRTVIAPVADGWASAFHRILIINNSGYLSLYVDGTLQNMQDSTGAFQATVIELGQLGAPQSPLAAEWLIGNTAAFINTMTWHQSSTTGYNTIQYKYIAVGDNLTDAVLLNSTINLTEPDQADSFTDDQVRPGVVMMSTQEDDSVSGYVYPVQIGLTDGTAGAIELSHNNTQVVRLDNDGVVGGHKTQAIIAANTTLDSRYMNVLYGVRTNLNTAVTITLPTFDRVHPGVWLYLYDLDGNANSKNVTINPNNAVTGYTLNGNTAAQTVITSNWGAVELIYDAYGNTDKNWLTVKHASTDFTQVYSNNVNTVLGIPDGPGTIVFASATTASRSVELPYANTCANKIIIVKRTDDGSTDYNLTVNKAALSSDNFDTPDVTYHRLIGKHDAAMYISDGGVLWKVFKMYRFGAEEVASRFSNFTLQNDHDIHFVEGDAITASLPAVAGGNYAGRRTWFKLEGNNTALTIDPSGSETIDNLATMTFKGRNKSICITGPASGSNWRTLGYTASQYRTVSADNTLAYPDRFINVNTAAASIVITLPPANSYAESMLTIKKITSDANTVTIDGNGIETIDGDLTQVLGIQWENITVASDGSSWYVIGV